MDSQSDDSTGDAESPAPRFGRRVERRSALATVVFAWVVGTSSAAPAVDPTPAVAGESAPDTAGGPQSDLCQTKRDSDDWWAGPFGESGAGASDGSWEKTLPCAVRQVHRGYEILDYKTLAHLVAHQFVEALMRLDFSAREEYKALRPHELVR